MSAAQLGHTYRFTRTPCGKWDVEHGLFAYDGRFSTAQARSFAAQLRLEGNEVYNASDGKLVVEDADLEPL